MAHPQLLLAYGGRATLAQAFSLVERLDQGLCVEEAGRLPSVMTATSGRSDTGTTSGGANQDKGHRGKGQNPQGGQKQLTSAMSAKEDVPSTSNVKYWGCNEEGHTKKECPLKVSPSPPPVPRGGQGGGRGKRGGRGQGRPNAPPAPPPYGQGNSTNIKCAYPPCSKPGHTETQCWMKYPHLRLQPFVPRGNQGGGSSSGGNNMEARLAELQDTLARLVAASAQPTPGATGSGASTSSGTPRLPHDPFEYGAAGQVISAVATWSQTGAPQVPTVAVDPLGRVTRGARHKGPVDGIRQSRLPMTFGLADVAANLPQGTPGGNDTEEGVIKSLALKILQVPFFSGAQLQYSKFDPAAVYLMAGKTMQGKAIVPAHASTKAMQAEKGHSSSLAVDEDGTRVQAAKAAK